MFKLVKIKITRRLVNFIWLLLFLLEIIMEIVYLRRKVLDIKSIYCQ